MANEENNSEENINEENQEFNDIDENFGLPDLDIKPADEVVEEETTGSEEVVNETENTSAESGEEESHDYSWEQEDAETETESYAEQAETGGETQGDDYVPGTYTKKMEENSPGGSKMTGVIVAVIVALSAAAGAYYWFKMKPEQDKAEKAKQEQLAKEKADIKKKEDYDKLIVKGDGEFSEEGWSDAESSYRQAAALYSEEQYPVDQLTIIEDKLDSIATASAKPEIGEIETISERTQRFYIIVSSSIDGDLAMDYASKISNGGDYVGIISPYGENKYYRLTLGSYDTWQDAESAVDSFSGTYGNGIWILKY